MRTSSGSSASDRLADEAELRDRLGAQADVVAEERHGARAERRPQLLVHRRERGAHDLDALGGRHAPAADELDRDAGALHLDADLRAGAVDDADLVVARELEHRARADRDATAPPTLTTMRLMSGSPR